MMMRAAIVAAITLAGVSLTAAETIEVKYYGSLDLKVFACTSITRSSFINRACYDKAQ